MSLGSFSSLKEFYYWHLLLVKKVKASSYIAQYSVLRTIQSALHFTSLTDLFTQTPFRLLWEASSHMVQLMREGCSYTYPPRSIVRYSFIQLSELEQCRVKKLAQGFNTAEQDSNPGSCSRDSEVLPLSHGALFLPHKNCVIVSVTKSAMHHICPVCHNSDRYLTHLHTCSIHHPFLNNNIL